MAPAATKLMGTRAPWLAFAGRHDEHGGAPRLVFRDSPANFSYPSQWFVRSTPFAAVCPAPFFDTEFPFYADAALTLRYDIAIARGRAGLASG